jgi:hypothetical protein
MPTFNLGDSNSAWIATQQWNDSYEAEFARWVERLFAKKTSTLAACLKNPAANTLYTDEDKNRSIYSDCADLPYVLRAYFSYKKKLPFSFNISISGGRYTNGNMPGTRRSFLNYSGISAVARAITDNIHSGFFRFAWAMENSDTYLAKINRDSIVPGTVYYDPNGHVLVVSRVDADGTVWFVDGHPDNSLTTKRFGEYLSRGSCTQGGGFRRWRHQEADNNGQFRLTGNQTSAFFDTGKSQCQSKYQVDGFDLNYHQWVKRMLASGSGKIDPLKELGLLLASIHNELIARVDSVKAAVSNGVPQKPHPADLPYNIYGATGDWESFATPGRDARLKAQTREAFNFISLSVAKVAQGNHPYQFNGTVNSLVREYQSIWNTSAAQLQITYRNSAATNVTLTLAIIMDRLFKLSFDPYHCPELRWGDTQATSCQDNGEKRNWYEREQRLRNVIDPNYQANTTLSWGPAAVPDIHLGTLLQRLIQQYP